MAQSNPKTTQLLDLLQKYRDGDATAGEPLASIAYDRLRQLAGQMLRGSERLKTKTTVDDLLQGAMLRLVSAVRSVPIESARHFHNLAALQLRRELIDLGRRCELPTAEVQETMALSPAAGELGRWIDLHEAIGELDGDDRDLINHLIYQGLSQHETGHSLGVSAKTVQRRWHSLCVRLYDRLGGRLPNS
jgi:RNA polymerase sigma factor (sigma-70 family)